jgi:hypothetical protein
MTTTRKVLEKPEILFAIPSPSGNQAFFYRIREQRIGSETVLCQEINPWGTILEKYREFELTEIATALRAIENRVCFPYLEDHIDE